MESGRVKTNGQDVSELQTFLFPASCLKFYACVRPRGNFKMSRKIYFAGSIRAGRDDVELYARIVGLLQKYGRVLTEHVGDPNLKESGTGTYASMDD